MLNIKSQRGLTMVEMMISITISMFLMLGLVFFFKINSEATFNNMKTVRLNSVLRSALDYMGREFMRAGYWSTSQNYIGSKNPTSGLADFATIDPFKTINVNNYNGTNNSVGACTNPATGAATDIPCTCAVFAYDRPVSQTGYAAPNGVLESTEYTGFRLNGKVIEFKKSGTSFSCTDGNWAVLTPAKVSIDTLKFNVVASQVGTINATNTITNRAVVMTITGSFIADPAFTATQTTTVDVRNDVIN